ncbi:MAG: cation-translocating P-type ATPase [Clostridiales bacterium]|jgi:Ca2+-transporting ATPase|nr:cation-translocating P-type ATPase [Clostridiales bacterium]
MKYYCSEVEDVLVETKSSRDGLSSEEAEKRLASDGKNKLAEGKKDSLIKRFFKQMSDPMIIILIAAALVSAITSSYSNEGFADVFIIMFVVIVNAVLGVYQENKAEKALEALQEMASATSKVLRDGKITVIKSEDIVVGDIVILEAGDAVPADGRIIDSKSMKIEEAALTGESVPVDKFIDMLYLTESKDVPLGDRKNMVYMGSIVVYGRGAAVITDTGMNTEMGKIADALNKAEEGLTPLQKKLAQLSKILTALVLGICAVIFAIGLIRAGSFSTDVILNSFMIAVSLAVAAIPEGLVAVVTIVLSIGVTNMSKKNAIIRKLTAVETLGCAQIICSDKTGTLTQNKMTVVEHYGDNKELLAAAMALCCDAELNNDGTVTGEPTENALVYWANSLNLPKYELKEKAPRIGEAPFDSVRKMMSTVHKTDLGVVQYTKGAPDEILRLCTCYMKDGKATILTDEVRNEILSANKAMADKALRVLAAAQKVYAAEPERYEPKELEYDLCFIGMTGMIDPVRPEVKDAIEQCRTAGIRPIMITGDHIDTASAIARELGIMGEGAAAVTGSQLSDMSDEEFEKRFRDISVYARVQPEHKVRIVNAWRKAGYITAMTGDGVNDAPSIKNADIGVGMGITGTDVTKNVADMVLADDNFATIVGAVKEGRRIYDNIRKAIQFLLSSNMSEVMSIFIATLLNFVILKPVHLLWINLVTDCFPALALGLESAEPDVMRRNPRSSRDGIFAGGVGIDVAYQGLIVTILTLAAYFIGHYMESGVWEIADSADGMTMAFLTMSMAEIFHSFNMRSQRGSLFTLNTHNKALIFAGFASLISTTLVLYVPFLADAFGFEHISLEEYGVALLLAVCIIPIVEIVKLCQRSYAARKSA